MKEIDFDLEKWQTGEYDVFTADGNEVTQLTLFNETYSMFFIVGVVEGDINVWEKNGNPSTKNTPPNDLKLRPKVKVIYYNVYLRANGRPYIGDKFDTKDEAIKSIDKNGNYLKTIPITNEPE